MDFFDETPREKQARRERMLREAADREAAEEARRAEAAAKATASTLRANQSAMVNEYRAAGVWPPEEYLDEQGLPKLSLGLLKFAGWTIETIGEQSMLIRPAGKPKRRAKKRSEVDRENS